MSSNNEQDLLRTIETAEQNLALIRGTPRDDDEDSNVSYRSDSDATTSDLQQLPNQLMALSETISSSLNKITSLVTTAVKRNIDEDGLRPPKRRLFETPTTTVTNATSPLSMSLDESIKILRTAAQIPTYDGSKDFDDWFQNILHNRRVMGWTEAQALFVAKSKLLGKASMALEHSKADGPSLTLDKLKSVMTSLCPTAVNKSTVWHELFNAKKKSDESVQQFSQRLIRLFSELTVPFDDAGKKQCLCRG